MKILSVVEHWFREAFVLSAYPLQRTFPPFQGERA